MFILNGNIFKSKSATKILISNRFHFQRIHKKQTPDQHFFIHRALLSQMYRVGPHIYSHTSGANHRLHIRHSAGQSIKEKR